MMFEVNRGGSRYWLGLLCLASAAAVLSLSGCGGSDNSSSGSSNPGSGGGGTAPLGPTITQSIPASGASVPLALSSTATLNVNFPAGAVPPGTSVTVTQVPLSALSVSLAHAIIGKALVPRITQTAKVVSPRFTLSPNNVYITAFRVTAASVTAFNVPLNLTGGKGLTPTGLPANTVLNIAELQNGGYVDIGTLTTTASGGFTQQQVSAALPGITQPGLYVVYQPAAGTNTAVANYGIALLPDDGNGPGAVQVLNLYDTNGVPLVTPKLTSLPFSNASDLDGAALTPDGTQGILVDGGNTVRFFSGVNTGVPVASTNTVDISSYGGDGDSVAIMPTGDEAIVSGDGSNSLLVISGILSGNPQTAATIPVPAARDGVVISNTGQTLLARGPSGLTVFAIAPTAPAAGALGGSLAHTFTQIVDLTGLGTDGGQEDGRDGIAFSPKDSTRAVVIGDSNNAPTISLLTSLPSTPVTANLRLRLSGLRPQAAAPRIEHRTGAKPHLTLTGISLVSSVSITPDGKNAIIGTNAGLVLVSGVDTGVLTQVGTPFNPTFMVGGVSASIVSVPTLGITLDGKYVVAVTHTSADTSSENGTLLMIPIQAGGFGAPVGQLDGIAVSDNDQILIH